VSLGAVCAVLAAHAAARRRIPLVHYWLDVTSLLLPEAFLRPMCAALEKHALRRAQLVLTINEVFRDFVVKWGADAERTRVVRAGIDGALFDPAAHSREESRRHLGLAECDLVLFFMGWLYPFSGVLEVAQDVVASADNNLTLVVAGEGDQYEALRALAAEREGGHRIRLLGQVAHAQLPGLVAAADVCLLPAYRDEPIMQSIVPIKLYEYMAMGKPVIATRLPGVAREFGEDNGMVHVNGPEEVVPTARALAQNGSLQDLGRRAREFVAYNTWDRVAEQFEGELEALVKEKAK
jgi:glycosyltransferase involved in cell wall biosynthesis